MEFIRRNKSAVPQEVIENVKKYLAENNLGELVEVRRMSDHPEDNYLYGVIAKKESKYFEGKYSCWLSWNETIQSMNWGHYHITKEDCERVLDEHFHRMEGINVIG